MNLNTLLSQFNFGKTQEAGIMSVIPLIEKEKTESPVAPLSDLKFRGTDGYGCMVFENKNSLKPVIVPAGYMILTKQLAQDHALPTSHILPVKKEAQEINFACCVEQTQGGYIEADDKLDFQLLPIHIRKEHAKELIPSAKRSSLENFSQFSRLWDHISKFQNKMIKDDLAHIVWFFNKFVSKLEEFNAEFEAVEGQRGAIILINNKVIGVEIAPTTEDWEILWKRLIRDTYGSEVIRLSYENLSGTFEDKQKEQLDLSSAENLFELRLCIDTHYEMIQDKVVGQLEELLANTNRLLSKKETDSVNGISYQAVAAGSDKLVELYTKDDKVVYASLVL